MRIAFLVRRASVQGGLFIEGTRVHHDSTRGPRRRFGAGVEKLQMQALRNRQDVQDKSRQRRIERALLETSLTRCYRTSVLGMRVSSSAYPLSTKTKSMQEDLLERAKSIASRWSCLQRLFRISSGVSWRMRAGSDGL